MATSKRIPALLFLVLVCTIRLYQTKLVEVVASDSHQVEKERHLSDQSVDDHVDVTIVKIGGSSITDKASFETLRPDVLNWFAKSIASSISSNFLDPGIKLSSNSSSMSCDVENNSNLSPSTSSHIDSLSSAARRGFVIVHGAGSFGHFQAKQYGLKGQGTPPKAASNDAVDPAATNNDSNRPTTTAASSTSHDQRRYQNRGLVATRLSVQKLNRLVVEALVDEGVNAVGISPCMNVPGLDAHAIFQPGPMSLLRQVVHRTVQAGMVPVLHGDACLYGDDQVGILSGDTLVEIVGTSSWISDAIFLTDVDGVYTDDPRKNPEAVLLREIAVDTTTKELFVESDDDDDSKNTVTASGSSHGHDVTGGLKVCTCTGVVLPVLLDGFLYVP